MFGVILKVTLNMEILCEIFKERKVITVRRYGTCRPFLLMLMWWKAVTFTTDLWPFKKSYSDMLVSIRMTLTLYKRVVSIMAVKPLKEKKAKQEMCLHLKCYQM